jgi:hypothetical protein
MPPYGALRNAVQAGGTGGWRRLLGGGECVEASRRLPSNFLLLAIALLTHRMLFSYIKPAKKPKNTRIAGLQLQDCGIVWISQ